MLKNRRKGDQRLKKTCKDLLDLVIFAAGLSDTFPKDTLSVNTSKFVDINIKLVELEEKIETTSKPSDTNMDSTVAILSNIIRDQTSCINKLQTDFGLLENYIRSQFEMFGKCKHCESSNNKSNKDNSIQLSSNTHIVRADIHQNDSSRGNHSTSKRSAGLVTGDANEVSTNIENHNATDVTTLNDHNVVEGAIWSDSITLGTTDADGDDGDALVVEASNTGGPVTGVTSPSYSDVAATAGPWLEQRSRPRRRRRPTDSNNTSTSHGVSSHSNSGALSGQKPGKSVMLYVQNVRMNDSDSEDDVVNKVKRHAKSKGANILSGHVVYNKFCDNIVGCKINIPASQETAVLRADFWPQDITCMPWQRQMRPGPSTETIYNGDSLTRTVHT